MSGDTIQRWAYSHNQQHMNIEYNWWTWKMAPQGVKYLNWWSMLRRSILLSFNNTNITCQQDLITAISKAKEAKLLSVPCEFAIIKYQAIHPAQGSLMLTYDQLNIIGKHLRAAYPQYAYNIPIHAAGKVQTI